MKRLKLYFPALTLCAVCCLISVSLSSAQDLRPGVIWSKLHSHSGVRDWLAGELSRFTEGKSVLLPVDTGIAIDPSLDLSRQEDRLSLSTLLDVIPIPGPVYQPSSRKVSSLYEQVLAHRELPIVRLSKEEQKRLREAEKVLFRHRTILDALRKKRKSLEPSRKYRQYQKYSLEYADALDALSAAQSQTGQGPSNMNQLKQRASNALCAWKTLGYKREVEGALSTYDSLTANDPNSWWLELRTRFENNQETTPSGNKFSVTKTTPTYAEWKADAGWTTFTFTGSDLVRGADAESSAQENGVKIVSVQLQAKRIMIERPWMDSSIFGNRAWKWISTSPLGKGLMISDGVEFSDHMLPSGEMPLLPVGFILARNVKLQWEDVPAGATAATVSSAEFKDMQIIAWLCDVLRKSPDPDPTLEWPNPIP